MRSTSGAGATGFHGIDASVVGSKPRGVAENFACRAPELQAGCSSWIRRETRDLRQFEGFQISSRTCPEATGGLAVGVTPSRRRCSLTEGVPELLRETVPGRSRRPPGEARRHSGPLTIPWWEYDHRGRGLPA